MDFQQAKQLFVENKLEYNETLHEKLEIYYETLIEYNNVMNLTAITEKNEVWIKHFLDSIITLNYAEIKKNAKVIDVGTGAGFPSVPLKIYRDDIKLTLLDSLNKRVGFLKELSARLSIETECIHARAEDAAKEESLRESFDVSTARAVASMPKLSEYCIPFVKPGGVFIALKGVNEEIAEAQNAVKILGGEIGYSKSYELDGREGRQIFVIKKISHTPIKYPRNSGQIKKQPL